MKPRDHQGKKFGGWTGKTHQELLDRKQELSWERKSGPVESRLMSVSEYMDWLMTLNEKQLQEVIND
jgi:hypothetical protein